MNWPWVRRDPRLGDEGLPDCCPLEIGARDDGDLEALVVAGYVFADDYRVPAGPRQAVKVSRCRVWSRWLCVRRRWGSVRRPGSFWVLLGYRLPGWFPHLPDQSQYNRRLRALTGLLTAVQQRLAGLLDSGGARLADGTLIGVANYAGCAQPQRVRRGRQLGYCAAKSEWVWGVRLVLRTDRRGLPLGYTLVPANEHEYEPLLDLVKSRRKS